MKKVFLLILSIISVSLLNAQVYDYVVAKDGSGNFATVQEAINAAATGSARTCIFIKKGLYQEKVYIGSNSQSINKVISLIGENRDSVVISWNDFNGIVKPYYTSSSNSTYGTPQSATMTINAADFYMENITVQNTYTAKQAVAVYTASDRLTFKNCRFVGFQDTYYPKKGRRYFFYHTHIEGGTDFICGGSINYFLQCTIKSLAGGSYITAPEDVTQTAKLSTGKTLYYGFIFKDCDLINDGKVANGTVYLGRPWQNTSGTVLLNCRLGNHIKPAGWYKWNADIATVSLAEFQSMNAAGTALADVSGRETWSMQLGLADVNNFLKLSTIYASLGSSTTYDPISLVVAPTPVSALTQNGQSLQWNVVEGAKGYVVYANGSVLGFSSSDSFTDTVTRSLPAVYAVRVVGAHGNLSLPDGSVDLVTGISLNELVNGVVTAVKKPAKTNPAFFLQGSMLTFEQETDFSLYTLTGLAMMNNKQTSTCNLNCLPKGFYVMKAHDAKNGDYQTKILL